MGTEVAELLKRTSDKIQDGGLSPNFQSLNRYNSAADCSISLKFGSKCDRVIADILSRSKGQVQGHSIT